MPVVVYDDYETGDTSKATATGGTFSVQTSVVNSGLYALRTNPALTGTGHADYGGLNVANSWIRFWFRTHTAPSASVEIMFQMVTTGGAGKMALYLNSTRNIVFTDQAFSTIGTTALALTADTWYQIDVEVFTGASAHWALAVNGAFQIGAENGNFTAVNGGKILLGKNQDTGGHTVDWYYDDMRWSNSPISTADSYAPEIGSGRGPPVRGSPRMAVGLPPTPVSSAADQPAAQKGTPTGPVRGMRVTAPLHRRRRRK